MLWKYGRICSINKLENKWGQGDSICWIESMRETSRNGCTAVL